MVISHSVVRCEMNVNRVPMISQLPPLTLVSPAESESNLESDSDGSEDDAKERDETETDTEAERTPLKLAKGSSSLFSTAAGLSAGCSPLNLQVIKTPSLPAPTIVTSSDPLAYHSTPSSSYSLGKPPGNGGNVGSCQVQEKL